MVRHLRDDNAGSYCCFCARGKGRPGMRQWCRQKASRTIQQKPDHGRPSCWGTRKTATLRLIQDTSEGWDRKRDKIVWLLLFFCPLFCCSDFYHESDQKLVGKGCWNTRPSRVRTCELQARQREIKIGFKSEWVETWHQDYKRGFKYDSQVLGYQCETMSFSRMENIEEIAVQ